MGVKFLQGKGDLKKKKNFRRWGPEPGAEVGLSTPSKGYGKSVTNCCLGARGDGNWKCRKVGGKGSLRSRNSICDVSLLSKVLRPQMTVIKSGSALGTQGPDGSRGKLVGLGRVRM